MDDKNFDRTAAVEWIEIIESERAEIRKKDVYRILREWVSSLPEGQVLDLGCGQGAVLSEISDLKVSYTGLDPSPFLITRARELFPSKKFVEGNIYNLPFDAGSFNGIFSIALWHLLSDLQRSTAELSRILKSGGKFLIISADPATYDSLKEKYKSFRIEGSRFEGHSIDSTGKETTDVLYLHTLDEITAELENCECTILGQERFRDQIALWGKKA